MIETRVVEDEAAACPYCDRPLPSSRLRALHLGEEHAEAMTAADREAYEAARDAETDELFVFHLKVIGAIAFMYAVFVLAYMVALS